MNEWFKNNWKAFALVSTLLISGVGGYTNLLLELGELRSDVRHYEETITQLSDRIYELEEKCE